MTALANISDILSKVFNPRGSFDVAIQDQITSVVDNLLSQKLKTDITITTAGAIGDFTLNVSAGHGFTAGSWIEIYEGTRSFQSQVQSVSTNELTLSLALSFAYTVAATVYRVNVEMNVNGAVTPVEFSYGPLAGSGVDLDIYGAVISMADAAAIDGGKFGGQAALTIGVSFSVETDVFTGRLYNVKRNQDLMERGESYSFDTKAPGGEYSFIVHRHFTGGGGQNGVAVRLHSVYNSRIAVVVRDNLTGLSIFRIAVFGHVVD